MASNCEDFEASRSMERDLFYFILWGTRLPFFILTLIQIFHNRKIIVGVLLLLCMIRVSPSN